ncbi:MAG: CAP domain-containing protein [Lachnospiraceae bacterium]|nr:CAP domain-containing protein [Lachnospiraceae bacterium]
MKQKVKKLFSLFLCTVFVFSTVSQTVLADNGGTATVRIDVTYGQTEARTMLDMVNEFRTGDDAWEWNEDDTTKTTYSDLKELVYDYELEQIAMQRAAEISLSFSHTRPNGTSCWTLYNSYQSCGENIAAGYATAEKAFEGWQETDKSYSGQGHRRNMLKSSFTAIGIGHAYFNGTHYWVQEFRNPASSVPAVEANDSKTTVSIDILLSDAAVSATAEPSSLTVACDESATLPTLNTTVQMTNAWPSQNSPVAVDYTWSVRDSQYAAISGNTVTGLKVGTTALTTSALGQAVSVPLTVEAAECQHSYDEGVVTTPATCTEEGIKTYTCTKCKNTYTEVIPATGHSYTKYVSNNDATCTKDGTKTAECDNGCGKKDTITDPGSATGHSYTYQDNGDGTHTVACKNGDNSKTEVHTYTNGVCVCGAKEPEEHTHTTKLQNAKDATCTEDGYTGDMVCTICGEMLEKGKVIPATGHNYIYTDNGDGTHTAICKKCDNTYMEAHTYEKDVCTHCGAKKAVKLSKPAVSSISNSTSGVKLIWGKVKNAKGYEIYRSANGGSYKKVKTTSATNWTDGSVQNGVPYKYKVYAYNEGTKSSASSAKSIYRLSATSISSLKNNKGKKMAVKWKRNSKASGYQIQYSTSSSFKNATKTTVSGNKNISKTISKLKKNKKYYVRVRSYKKSGSVKYYSAWSKSKNVTIKK